MPKRARIAKRRDRKTGESPYAKHNKAPFQYSSSYHSWRARTTGKAHKAST